MLRTPDLIEHQTPVVRLVRGTLAAVVTRVLRGTPTPGARVTPAVLVQPVMQGTLDQVRLLVARATQELPEIKELLVTLETQEMRATLVLTQTSVIL